MAENSLIADIRAYRNRSAFKQPYVPLASAICVLCDEDIPQTSEQDLIDHDAMPITVKATGAAAEALIGLYPTMNFGPVRMHNVERKSAFPNTKDHKYLLCLPHVRESYEIDDMPIPYIETTDATWFEPLNPADVHIKAEYSRAVMRRALVPTNYDVDIGTCEDRADGAVFNGYGLVQRAYVNSVFKNGRTEKSSRIYMKNPSDTRNNVSVQLWNSGALSYSDKFLLFVDCFWTKPFKNKEKKLIDQLLVTAQGAALLIDRQCLSQAVIGIIENDDAVIDGPRHSTIQSLIQRVDQDVEGSTEMDLRVGVHTLKTLIIRNGVEKIRCSEFVESSGESSPSKRAKGNLYVISRPLDVEVTFDAEGNAIACVRATVVSRGDSLVVSLSFE
eukprot:26701_1